MPATPNSRHTRPGFQFLKRQLQIQEWLEKIFNKKYDATVGDDFVAQELKNGVLLCKLMLILDERSIPHYHPKPNSPLKIRENVFFFIEACKDRGIPRHKVFLQNELLEMKNLIRVLETLESLSETAVKNLNFAIPIEPIKDDEIDFLDEAIGFVEENYLQKIKGGRSPSIDLTATPSPMTSYDDTKSVNERKKTQSSIQHERSRASTPVVLQPIDESKLQKIEVGISALQAIVRGKRVRREYQQNLRLQSFRTNVAKEILQTEEIYVERLNILIKLYKVPLTENSKSKKPFVTEEQVKTIFSDIEIILGYNKQLLEEMTPRVKNWTVSQCLGDIFVKITNFLKIYSNYVQHYDNALEVLSTCKKSSKFDAFLDKTRDEPENNLLTLEMYLIMPIQRIPRYNLLLSELLKYTWKDHKDYKDLEESHSKMKEVASYVNEKKREFENIAKVRQVQEMFDKKLDFNLVDPSRKFIRKDVVAQWTGTNDTDKKNTEFILFLFNDLIVIASDTSKETIKFKEAIKISRASIKEAKLRKWTLKKNDVGKLWPTKKEVKSRSGSMIADSNSESLGSSGEFSMIRTHADRDSIRRLSVSLSPFSGGRSARKDSIARFYSVKNTVELVNSAEETLLKVCFDNPLLAASWQADFKKAKDVLEQFSQYQEEKAMERALKKSENTKSSIASKIGINKTMEERKAEWRNSKGSASSSPAVSPTSSTISSSDSLSKSQE